MSVSRFWLYTLVIFVILTSLYIWRGLFFPLAYVLLVVLALLSVAWDWYLRRQREKDRQKYLAQVALLVEQYTGVRMKLERAHLPRKGRP